MPGAAFSRERALELRHRPVPEVVQRGHAPELPRHRGGKRARIAAGPSHGPRPCQHAVLESLDHQRELLDTKRDIGLPSSSWRAALPHRPVTTFWKTWPGLCTKTCLQYTTTRWRTGPPTGHVESASTGQSLWRPKRSTTPAFPKLHRRMPATATTETRGSGRGSTPRRASPQGGVSAVLSLLRSRPRLSRHGRAAASNTPPRRRNT